MIDIAFKNKLFRSLILSLSFLLIFNISSNVVYAHENKDTKVVGALVSAGLYSVSKAAMVAFFSSLAIRAGMDMRYGTHSVAQDYVDNNLSVLTGQIAQSKDGTIAGSFNAVKGFMDYLSNLWATYPDGTIGDNVNVTILPEEANSYWGLQIGPFTKDVSIGRFESTTNPYQTLKKGEYLTLKGDMSGYKSSYLIADHYRPDGTLWTNHAYFNTYSYSGVLSFPKSYDWGNYYPDTMPKTNDGEVYSNPKQNDFVWNPSWDVNSGTGDMAGAPPLPWTKDKDYVGNGQAGVLNPDGTITKPDVSNPSIPDVDNPSVPDTGTGTGFLEWLVNWLKNFFKNLFNGLLELIKFLLVPTLAISTWETFSNNFQNKFRFMTQIKDIKFSTSNNEKISVKVPIAGSQALIELPDSFESQVSLFRNVLKWGFYIITLFSVIAALRPKFTINSD